MVIYRNVASVVAGAALMQFAIGALGVTLPVAMARAGWSGLTIGGVVAAHGAGFLVGARFAPGLICTVGHIRAYAACAGAGAALTLWLALNESVLAWLLARLLFGAFCAGLFAVAESWIADATPSDSRGQVVAFYQVAGRVGLIGGPVLLAAFALELVHQVIVAGAFLALALIPITATRRQQPALPTGVRASPLGLLRAAPAAAAGVFLAGLINTGVLSFAPIWADGLTAGETGGAAAWVMGAIYGGSMAFQWPAGLLSDRLDRRIVIAGLALASGLVGCCLALVTDLDLVGAILLAGLWGTFGLTGYGICIAHAADRAPTGELSAIASGSLMIWGLGSMIGPLLAGPLYSSFGGRGLFLYAAAGGFVPALLALGRRLIRPAPAETKREPFVNLMATSGELGEIDAESPDTSRRASPAAARTPRRP